MTIELFLKGKFEYEFTDLNIQSTLEGRGLIMGTEHSDVSEKDADLALSDLYMILANVTSGRGKMVSKGNRSVTGKSTMFTKDDRATFRNEAIRLRMKWGEKIDAISTVRFVNLFGR
jgi:ATP-dependent phosphoenolpyruvate carboxykinase